MKLNMVLNAIKGILSIVFPLISFPYVSKTLGVTNIGRYNFSNSIISYFLLLATLGIKTYAVREGARIRDFRRKFEFFASEMFSISIISTCISYAALIILMIIVPKFSDYKDLLIILSFQIFFTTIGVEWVYTVYEEFMYITIRSIIFYAASLILLFILVRDKNDLNIYAAITVFSSVGSNIMNYIHCKKYCRLRLIKKLDWKRHLKPILMLFAIQIATTIYTSSDTTMLGFLCNDDVVGIYSVSSKIYTIVKTLLASVIIVSIPKLSAFLGRGDKKGFNHLSKDIYSTLLTVAAPALLGIILLRKEVVLVVSNESYLSAISSLTILCVALIFCLCAWFWGQCILVPQKMEGFVFKSTLVSAVINIVLNFILIPYWKEEAAAFTTLLSEAAAFFAQWVKGRKYVEIRNMWKIYLKITIGCGAVCIIAVLINPLKQYMILYTVLMILLSILSYGIVEFLLKNESICSIVNSIQTKIKEKKVR